MARKRRNRARVSGEGSVKKSGQTLLVSRGFQTITSSGGVGSVSITPTNFCGQRGGEFIEAWQMFRFKKILINMHPTLSASAGVFATLGFSTGNATAPTTAGAIMSLNKSVMNASQATDFAGTTVPTRLSLNTTDLLESAPNKWWRTQASASVETWEEVQGNLFTSTGGATETVTFDYISWCEFAGPLAPTMIPRPLFSEAAQEQIRKTARDEMMKAVCMDDSLATDLLKRLLTVDNK